MVLVVPAHENAVFRDLLTQYLPEVEVHLVSGGSCRTESVKNGLAALPPDTRIAAIHDAARPLAGLTLLSSLAETVMRENCGAIAAEKMVDSVCRTDGEGVISESVSREGLWRIQTPQVFLYREICSVYARLGKVELTDDSAAARSCGCRVKVCANAAPNPKLTYKEDLPFLEHLLKKTLGTEN